VVPLQPERANLSNRGAAGGRAGARGIHPDHAGLIGEVHILSTGRSRNWRSRYGIRLVAVAGGVREDVAALDSGREHGVNQVCSRGAGRVRSRSQPPPMSMPWVRGLQVRQRRWKLTVHAGIANARRVYGAKGADSRRLIRRDFRAHEIGDGEGGDN